MTNSIARLLIIYCGGTIGMTETADGLQPNEKFADLIVEKLAQITVETIDIVPLEPLIDSANARPQDWVNILTTIKKYHQHYDGFVVLHGTDTLAYTAAALSLWCDALGKAIILTGAQRPMIYADSDGLANVLGAIHYARHRQFAQVAVYFGGVLLNPRAVRKMHAQADQAFATPNSALWGEQLVPSISQCTELSKVHRKDSGKLSGHRSGHRSDKVYDADFKSNHTIKDDLIAHHDCNRRLNSDYTLYKSSVHAQPVLAPFSQLALLSHEISHSQVALLHLTPAMPDALIEAAFAEDIKAVVLLSYGAGNIADNASLTRCLHALSIKKQWVINCTQCVYGRTAQTTYATGVRHEGVYEGKYISYEFAYVLSYFAVQLSLPAQQIMAQINHVNDIASETATL